MGEVCLLLSITTIKNTTRESPLCFLRVRVCSFTHVCMDFMRFLTAYTDLSCNHQDV